MTSARREHAAASHAALTQRLMKFSFTKYSAPSPAVVSPLPIASRDGHDEVPSSETTTANTGTDSIPLQTPLEDDKDGSHEHSPLEPTGVHIRSPSLFYPVLYQMDLASRRAPALRSVCWPAWRCVTGCSHRKKETRDITGPGPGVASYMPAINDHVHCRQRHVEAGGGFAAPCHPRRSRFQTQTQKGMSSNPCGLRLLHTACERALSSATQTSIEIESL